MQVWFYTTERGARMLSRGTVPTDVKNQIRQQLDWKHDMQDPEKAPPQEGAVPTGSRQGHSVRSQQGGLK